MVETVQEPKICRLHREIFYESGLVCILVEHGEYHNHIILTDHTREDAWHAKYSTAPKAKLTDLKLQHDGNEDAVFDELSQHPEKYLKSDALVGDVGLLIEREKQPSFYNVTVYRIKWD